MYGSDHDPYLHVMRTTRPMKILYIDGSSAVLSASGTLDLQSVMLGRNISTQRSDPSIYDEKVRRHELCSWLTGLNIEGLVRMNVGFEVLVCDLESANLKEVYSVNATLPSQWKNDQNKLLPRDSNRSPPHGYGTWYSEQLVWEWLRSATAHYGGGDFAGDKERRVRLDLCSVVTFYDPSLASLSHECLSSDTYQCSLGSPGFRAGHRLLHASSKDVDWIHACSREATSGFLDRWRCTGIDWQLLTEHVTNYHKPRLLQSLDLTEAYFNGTMKAHRTWKRLHELFHALTYPYSEASVPTGHSIVLLKREALDRCVLSWIGEIEYKRLNRLEKIIWNAIKHVLQKLCEHEWAMLQFFDESSHHSHHHNGHTSLHEDLRSILHSTVKIISWLGWDRPTRCQERCEYDEICYIPMWPLIYSPGHGQGGVFAGERLLGEELKEFWRPKCISRYLYDRGGGKGRDPWHQNARVDDVPYDENEEDRIL